MQERSRSPALPDAHDRRSGDVRPQEAGSLVPFAGVRCPNPKCHNKLAEDLHGTLIVTCRKCGLRSTIVR
jgi:hypothetical protein